MPCPSGPFAFKPHPRARSQATAQRRAERGNEAAYLGATKSSTEMRRRIFPAEPLKIGSKFHTSTRFLTLPTDFRNIEPMCERSATSHDSSKSCALRRPHRDRHAARRPEDMYARIHPRLRTELGLGDATIAHAAHGNAERDAPSAALATLRAPPRCSPEDDPRRRIRSSQTFPLPPCHQMPTA
jgi:hypothetical protein